MKHKDNRDPKNWKGMTFAIPFDQSHQALQLRNYLAAHGLDPDNEFPKPLTDEAARAADVIITMGCGDACPFYPGKRYLDWELTDPAGKSVEEVRPIIDAIDERVRQLLAELLGEAVA